MQIDDDLSMLPTPKPPLLCQYRSIWQLHSFCINYIFSVARVNPQTQRALTDLMRETATRAINC